jgi:molybdate transport system substrate-binding protein
MKTFIYSAFMLVSLSALLHARTVNIAAASDLKFCLDLLVADYRTGAPADSILVTYGSSGKTFTQLRQGAPFDIYFSADIEYPRKLSGAGLTTGEPRLYAVGRIVLWSDREDASKLTLQELAADRFSKIAIANPLHAPYGKRAEEALKSAGVYPLVASRLVFGENIAQAAQFVQSGNAPIGILALSLVKTPACAGKPYYLIPTNLHQPLEQGLVIMKRAKNNDLARDFVMYLFTKKARTIFAQYGFTLPGE